MGVSKNNGTPKSSILIGFSIIDHPFWDTPIFGNTQIAMYDKKRPSKNHHCRMILGIYLEFQEGNVFFCSKLHH